MDLQRALSDPRRFRRAIERLFDRTLFTAARRTLRQDGVSIDALFDGQRGIARRLARAAGRGSYAFEPGRVRSIRIAGRRRDVYSFRLTDMLVHAVAAEVIEEAGRPLRSSCLFSYRKGVSWADAIRGFAAYVRAREREHPDPRTRGLHVLRRDIDAYTDSIPVHPGSPLWSQLAGLFDGQSAGSAAWPTLEEVVRPLVIRPQGGPFRLMRGVPTGQPIACVLFNLYLHELDRRLASIAGGFYARYSDDILFAHPEPGPVLEAARIIEAEAAGLELKLKAEKGSDLFLNRAARPSPAGAVWKGTAAVPFLGTDVGADGTIALGREPSRALLRDLADRAARTARTSGEAEPDKRGRAVCTVINRVLRPDPAPLRQRSADILRRLATSRPHLRHLDFLIARIAAHAASGIAGPRAFRFTPYRRIRRAWGLASLLQQRNRGRRRG